MAQLTDDLARLLAGRQPDLMDKRGELFYNACRI